tara:strand:- start:1755 stop:2459 length:705 start_codon:yes stop_codon:yes gene_type:complete
MSSFFNIYCDESCHLENDKQKSMVLGAIWSPKHKSKEISQRIREIKVKHKLKSNFEVKWTKVSDSKFDFYLDVLDYFFDDDDLHFRGVVIPDKSGLNHDSYNQTHDEWYYKMYFTLLKTLFEPHSKYNVYIDIKDTLGHEKVDKLHNVLCNNSFDFNRQVIQRVQRVQSHESEQLQIADLLIGALSYLHRGLEKNKAKTKLIERIKQRTKYSLKRNTLLLENKFNLLIWNGGYS